MELEDRAYQLECVNAWIEDIVNEEDKWDPIVVIPTAGGKSVIVCMGCDEYLSLKPERDVLVLSHVDTILEQNYTKLASYFGADFIGLYSAGLGEKYKKKITVAGIQSIYKKPELFTNVGLVMVDECHLVNTEEKGMYRDFIKKLRDLTNHRVVLSGLTASPFRTGQGYIYKKYSGESKPLFNKVSYDLTSYENYEMLISEGYLCRLIPAPTSYTMDADDVPTLGGDFVTDELASKFNRDEITEKICDETIKYAKQKYKKWLIFAIDKLHALAIVHLLEKKGVTAKAIYSGMNDDKNDVIKRYRKGEWKALVNINMATTGVDVPEIDLIVHMRPSKSPVYHVQTNGRGARPAPWIQKTHCLVLDFADNISRHGPINDLRIFEPGDKRDRKGVKTINTKKCKNCGTHNSLRATLCIACEEEFVIDHKLNTSPSAKDIFKDKNSKPNVPPSWIKVKRITYSIHQKAGSPNSLRVIYHCGFNSFSEWVCIDHDNEFLKRNARFWIKKRYDGPMPKNLNELVAIAEYLKNPSEIFVDVNGKYAQIKDFKFEHKIEQQFKKNLSQFDFEPYTVPKNGYSFDYEDDIPF